MFGKFVSELKSLIPAGSQAAGKQALVERRDHTRLTCLLEIECRQVNRDHEAVATNVSATGVGIEAFAVLDPHQEVYLSYRPGGTPQGRQRLKCRIVWSRPSGDRSYFYGLQFIDEQSNIDQSWAVFYMRQKGFNPHQAFKRKSRRIECGDLEANLIHNDSSLLCQVSVIDLGLGGARLTLQEKLEKNQIATLEIAEIRLLCRIIHVRPGNPGFQLNARFLNRPDSAEITTLSQFLLDQLRKKQAPR